MADGSKTEYRDELALRSARVINEWLYTDSRLRLPEQDLYATLRADSDEAGFSMTDEQCAIFVCGEHSDPEYQRLCAAFHRTSELIDAEF